MAEAAQQGLESLSAQVADAQHSAEAATWRDEIPQDLRGEKVWETFKSKEDVYKAHANLVKYQGRSIGIPDDKATEDDWNQFYAKLGRPEAPDKYELKRPENLPENLTYSDDLEKWFRDVAHKHGLSAKQATGLYNAWNENAAQMFKQPEPESVEQVEANLKTTWGKDYQANMANVERFTRAYLDDEFVKFADEVGLGNDIRFLNVMARAGAKLREDTSIDTTRDRSTGAGDREAAQKRYAEIMADKAYLDPSDPRHALLHSERERLFHQLHG